MHIIIRHCINISIIILGICSPGLIYLSFFLLESMQNKLLKQYESFGAEMPGHFQLLGLLFDGQNILFIWGGVCLFLLIFYFIELIFLKNNATISL
jgi:hypothetical protein